MAEPGNGKITIFLADDNIIVREGVRALLAREKDFEILGVAGDYDELIAGAEEANPQVLVTDIRMPPSFQSEGIDAAKELRKRHPGTGVVILSQYDDPEYAISLLEQGSAGYGYLLKDRIAEGSALANAIRAVASGGTALDASIVDAIYRPVKNNDALNDQDEDLLRQVAEGRPMKAIAVNRQTTAADIAQQVEDLFLKLANDASSGVAGSLKRLRMLHQAIVEREETGETLSRLLPGGLAEKLRSEGRKIGETERLEVTVIMADIRGYSGIAETADPSELAQQLNTHRAEMNHAIIDEGGTVMQFVGDAVMAVFGAPFPSTDHAERALAAARSMHRRQAEVNERWAKEGLPAFGLGIGLSTGQAAAALLGSEERLEYTLVGDTVNLAARLQQWALAGEIILSETTYGVVGKAIECEELEPAQVKGRQAVVKAYRVPAVPVRVEA